MKKNVFIRDKRSPIPKNINVSKVMSANKAKNTKPEILLRRELCQQGLNKYRLNYKKAPGRPDIVFVSKKIAIFVHGCFWHRCPYCKLPLPKRNQMFWKTKFLKNKERDKSKIKELRKMKWAVLSIWECQIQKKIIIQINKIYKIYHA